MGRLEKGVSVCAPRSRFLVSSFPQFFIVFLSIACPLAPSLLLAAPAQTSFGVVAGGGSRVFPKTQFAPSLPMSENDPVLMTAAQLDYDQNAEVVVASGQVEISQGGTVVLADQLLYDQKRGEVSAYGNVSVLEPSGNVYFADALALKDDMKAGVIRHFKARLVDGSLFVAAGARKIDEQKTELTQAVYSPCVVECREDGEGASPQWQLKADHVLIDQEAQKVTYDDARFEVYGMPLLYTPYFSHPTPGADNQSGLLTPSYQQSGNLGSVFRLPVYYSLAPDKDITITPIYTSNENLVMAGEYRQMLDSGFYIFDGSVTRPQERDALGSRTSGNQVRGHINGRGDFRVNEYANWGFDVHRTTDDTYLRRYDFGYDTLLTSRAYLEGFNFVGNNDRTYGSMQAVGFQGLTTLDDSNTIPVILPLMDFSMQSDPGIYNSRTSFSANALGLMRDDGAKSRRLSATAGWNLPYITDDGQIIEFKTTLRGDIYSVEDVLLSDGRQFDGFTGRLVPQASLNWRYPFINRWESSSLLFEPVVNFTVSPGGGNPEKISNEDSLVPEFTDTNLFSENRFAGYDRIENGPRVSYGLRGQAQVGERKYVDWMVGQHYRVDPDRYFPFSNDLGSHFSDYVGKVGVSYRPVSLAYRFRLDKDELTPKRNEIDAGLNLYPLSLSGAYLSIRNDPVLATREEVVGSATVNLSKKWLWSMSGRRDLEINQLTSAATGLTFHNQCTHITTLIGREYTRDRDIKPSTSFLLQFSLRNLE